MEMKSLEELPSEILLPLANQILKILYGRAKLDATSEVVTVEAGSKTLDFLVAELKATGSDRADLLFCTLLRLTGATLQNTEEVAADIEAQVEAVEVLKN